MKKLLSNGLTLEVKTGTSTLHVYSSPRGKLLHAIIITYSRTLNTVLPIDIYNVVISNAAVLQHHDQVYIVSYIV